jgi:chemotaxis protein methyltransferase CheR
MKRVNVAVPSSRETPVRALEARTGLEASAPLADKLLRLLARLPPAERHATAERLEHLPAEDPRWRALIEQLTVHETYVMRDPEQLRLMATLLPGLIAEAAAAGRFRLRFWSVGCASGEEAYTLAALAFEGLLEAGLAFERGAQIELREPWQVEVLGGDIAGPVLALARAGVYETGPLSSFRDGLGALLRFFPLERAAAGAQPLRRTVHPCLRRATRFEPFNLVSDPLPQGLFDAVVCRNVLVHFSARARAAACVKLQAAVRPGGCLLLGPTDALADSRLFETLWAPGAVLQRRRPADG